MVLELAFRVELELSMVEQAGQAGAVGQGLARERQGRDGGGAKTGVSSEAAAAQAPESRRGDQLLLTGLWFL